MTKAPKRKPRASEADAARKKAAAALKKAKRIVLAGHVRPDGDCLGSALALALALQRMGKEAVVHSRDAVPANLRFLPGADKVVVGPARGRFDVAAFMECSAPDRSGGVVDMKEQVGTVIHTDSHIRSQPYGDINIIEPDMSSTAEQIWRLLKLMGVKVDRDIATCIYVGLVTDTGRFHYSNTTPSALRMCAELLETGFDPVPINDALFATHPLPALKLWASALTGLRLEHGGRVAVLTVTQEDYRRARAWGEHTEDIVNFGMMVPGVQVSMILKEEHAKAPSQSSGTQGAPEARGDIRVSLRARGTVDVSAIALEFGGGGHKNASGCTLTGTLEDAQSRLLEAVARRLSPAAAGEGAAPVS